MNSGQLLQSFISTSIHTQLLIHIIHILRSSKVLQDVLHVLLLVISRSVCTTEGGLVMDTVV